MPDFDLALFANIQAHADELKSKFSERDAMDDEMEQMYLMDWTAEKPTNSAQKTTISPQPRNAVKGIINLMTAADPVFSVPYDQNDASLREQSEKLEKAARAMWYTAGRVRQTPVHYDAVTSAALFGEVHMGVTLTADMLAAAKGGSKASLARIERIAKRTPVLFDVYDPRTGYPEFDEMGLSVYYRRAEVKSGTILDRWGEKAVEVGLRPLSRFETIYLCDFWDMEWHVTWIEGRSMPLMMEQHNLPVIPIICQITDGSSLHGDEEYKRQPPLYTLWKSGLWLRQNLALSVLYTNAFNIGANPMYLHKTAGEPLDMDWDVPGGVVHIRPGEDFAAVDKRTIDPSVMTAWQLAEDLGTQSTIYKQALGEPLGANAPYSSVALLAQAGRLPLVSIQRRTSEAIGSAMETALRILKETGKQAAMQGRDSVIKLKASDIPDDVTIEAKLDIDLPQDMLQQANVAQLVTKSGLMSTRWARENLLKEGQSGQMQREIWSEQAADIFGKIAMQQQAERLKAQFAQVQQQGQAPQGMPQMPPGAPMPQGMPPAGRPEMPGAAMQGGLPQVQGGAIPAQMPMDIEGGM